MNYVAYYRVSTVKQGISGLGLDAQRSAVENYIKGQNGEANPVSFTEIESGSNSSRPQLQAALSYCRDKGAKLIIAKLDRLSRNVHFISGLMESGVEFIACDMPQANKLTLHILAAVAEAERDMTSVRTKAAYQSHTKGTWGKVTDETLQNRRDEKLSYLDFISPHITTLQGINIEDQVEALNNAGLTTRSGNRFNKHSLYRVKREIMNESRKKILH